jgi:hypothetical protein
VETRDGEATEDDNLKASDADRQQVADRLGTAVGEGRLTLQEYRDRAGQTCAARTHGESPPTDLNPHRRFARAGSVVANH